MDWRRLFGSYQAAVDFPICTFYPELLEAFERHRREVVRRVPADRPLVYEVKQGWGPLCALLGLPEPEAAFPHLNQGEDLAARMTRALLLGEDDVFASR